MAFAGWSDVLSTGPVSSVADWYLGGSHDSAGCVGPEAVFARPFLPGPVGELCFLRMASGLPGRLCVPCERRY